MSVSHGQTNCVARRRGVSTVMEGGSVFVFFKSTELHQSKSKIHRREMNLISWFEIFMIYYDRINKLRLYVTIMKTFLKYYYSLSFETYIA